MPDASLPLISVIMATYNRQRYIYAALESILCQAYAPLEIIVVDDGSTDNTATVVSALLEETGAAIHYVQQANCGTPAAHNEGLRQSHGAIIAFLDSDDLWSTDRLPAQMAWFAPDPAAGGTIPAIVLGRNKRFADGVAVNTAELATANAHTVHYSLGSSLFARWVFGTDAVGFFDETLRYNADWDWFVRARPAGIRMVACPDVTLRVRIHVGNLTQDRAASARFIAQMVKKHLDRQRLREKAGAFPTEL